MALPSGGFVGYLGYELKAHCGGDRGTRLRSAGRRILLCRSVRLSVHDPMVMPMQLHMPLPRARQFSAPAWLMGSVVAATQAAQSCRLVVTDHKRDDVFVVALAEAAAADNAAAADSWLASTAAQISRLAAAASHASASAAGAMRTKQHLPMQPSAVANGHPGDASQRANGTAVAPLPSMAGSMPAATDGRGPRSAARPGPDPDMQLQPKHSKAQYLRNVSDCLQVGSFDTECICWSSAWPSRACC